MMLVLYNTVCHLRYVLKYEEYPKTTCLYVIFI